jgi:hypothetical protein
LWAAPAWELPSFPQQRTLMASGCSNLTVLVGGLPDVKYAVCGLAPCVGGMSYLHTMTAKDDVTLLTVASSLLCTR